MDSVPELTEWIDEHWDEATGYSLQVFRAGDTSPRTYKAGKMEDAGDPGAIAQELMRWAVEFKAKNDTGRWHAMLRVKDEDGKFTKVIKNFYLPIDTSSDVTPFALSDGDIQNNTGLKVFMQLVDGERKRTEVQLQVSQQREEKLFDTILETIKETRDDRQALLSEMREERGMFLTEIREDRKSHDERIGPIIAESANALSKAAELVRIHQENNTQVQLKKLEIESEDKKWDLAITVGGPILESIKAKIQGKMKKNRSIAPTTQDDSPPPDTGPCRELFIIFEKLSDAQISDVQRVIGADHFKALDDAAHSGRDDQTTAALRAFAAAAEEDPDRISKTFELLAVLGPVLAKKLTSLISKATAEPEPEVEPEPEPAPSSAPQGYVEGLRGLGLHELTEEKQVVLAEQLGPALTGVLIAGAEGDDQLRAFAAVCTLGAQLNILGKKLGEEEAEKRFNLVLEALGDDEKLLNLIVRANTEYEGDET